MREMNLLKQVPWLVFAAVLVAGSTLWLLFVGQQESFAKMAFRNQVERLSDELFRSRLEGSLSSSSLPVEVQTFALYTAQGDLVSFWGSPAPDRLDLSPFDTRRGPMMIPHKNGWIQFIKPLQPLRPRMPFFANPGRDGRPERIAPDNFLGHRRPIQGYLFMTVSASSLFTNLLAWTVGAIVGLAGWVSFVAFACYLWFKSRNYQSTLAHHRELLQFAEASRTLSHELQNPLAAILLQTALLKRSVEGPPAPEVLLIEEEAQRMSSLVGRVRDFLKDPKGQVEALNLEEAALSLADRFSTPILVSSDGKSPYSVSFDPHRLRSVVENLLKNAVESAPDKSPAVRLSRPRSGWVRLEVLDDGAGFTVEALRQALQPFYTTKTTGTGIGLSIAEGFVRAAGGRLRLENRPKGGARVLLDLPSLEKGNAL